jgi:hypothetical protein
MTDEKFRAEVKSELAADIAGRKRDDGGPAFPVVSTRLEGEQGEYYPFVESSGGMTLRDYFATKAMNGFCVGHARLRDEFDPKMYEMFSQHAYLIADAMLAERAKR